MQPIRYTAIKPGVLHGHSIGGPGADGFSLIEVLVALLVLSIGLLGLAALQTFGMQYNQQSYQRTQAIFQAYDIVDRIRANPAGKTNSCYDAIAEGAVATIAPCVVAYRNCEAQSCIPNELANYDVNEWNTANGVLLVGGKGSIVTNGTRRTITVKWIENDLPTSFILEIDL